MSCPGCDLRDRERELLERQVRNYADELARFAGGLIGGRIAGPRGNLIGRELAPRIIETGALAIADTVKRKRTRKQKSRAKALGRAMKTVNKRARKKNGKLKAGWSQRRILQTAHKLVKK